MDEDWDELRAKVGGIVAEHVIGWRVNRVSFAGQTR